MTRQHAGNDRSIRCLSRYEREARERGFVCIAGVDEVGRGALFGAVFAAAVVLNPERPIRGLRDSKVLDAEAREALAQEIQSKSVAWATGAADAFEIDQINILPGFAAGHASSCGSLSIVPDYLLIDAVTIDLAITQEPLIDGDARCRAIAAASIVAKVHRDACMNRWQEVFPEYNLAATKDIPHPTTSVL